jgi:hypothetical protein
MTRRAAVLQEENRLLLSEKRRKDLEVAQLQERQRVLEDRVLQKSVERRLTAKMAAQSEVAAHALRTQLVEELRASAHDLEDLKRCIRQVRSYVPCSLCFGTLHACLAFI